MSGAASGSSSSPKVLPEDRRRFRIVWRMPDVAGVA